MKKLLLLLLFVPFLFSCSSDSEDCDCGIIESMKEELDVDIEWTFFADIRNECTNEIENDVQITENIYDNYFTGDRFCNISKNRLN